MKNVLVTGATGFIGFEVARQLVARGLRPRVVVRRPERGRLLRALDAQPVYADLEHPATLARAVEGMDTVLHLGARATFERYESVRPTIVDGSLALLRAARDAGVERFVLASSLMVYGSSREPIGLETPTRPAIGYGRAKVEAEDALRREAPDSMRLALLRLPHVYGARSYLFDRLRAGFVIFPGDGRNVYSHLHVADAATLLIEAAARDWSGTLPIGDDRPSTWNEYFGVIEEHYTRFRRLRLPGGLAVAGATALEWLMRWRDRPTLHSGDTVRGWLLDLNVEPGLARDALGVELRYPTIDEGLPASLDDSVAFRWLHPVADGRS